MKLLPLAFALIPAVAAAQSVPTRTVGRPEAEFAEPFTRVSGVRELRDGRLIVGDLRDQTLQRIDLGTGDAVPVARRGAGPNEYDMPVGAFAMPGDSTLVFDPNNQRYLVIGPDAKPAGTFTLGEATGMRAVGRRVKGVDTHGRLYYQGSSIPALEGSGGPPPEALDSVAIVRYDRRSGRHDTLGMIKGPELQLGGSSRGNTRMVMFRQQPLTASDDWAVAPDGRVAVARSGKYGLDWIANGKRVPGAAVAYTPIKVTKADKDEWERQARSARPMMRAVGGGGRLPPPPVPDADEMQWPEVKPAFTDAAAAVSPEGEAWVRRTVPAGETRPHYDVFDGSGRLVAKAVLPAATRLVGFGRGALYLVRTDEDGLEWLGRYRR
jgi:hypothetical protein